MREDTEMFCCDMDSNDYIWIDHKVRFFKTGKPGVCRECHTSLGRKDPRWVESYATIEMTEDNEDCCCDAECMHRKRCKCDKQRRVIIMCERCGDLAQSYSELGYCWIIGELLESHKEYLVAKSAA